MPAPRRCNASEASRPAIARKVILATMNGRQPQSASLQAGRLLCQEHEGSPNLRDHVGEIAHPRKESGPVARRNRQDGSFGALRIPKKDNLATEGHLYAATTVGSRALPPRKRRFVAIGHRSLLHYRDAAIGLLPGTAWIVPQGVWRTAARERSPQGRAAWKSHHFVGDPREQCQRITWAERRFS
jgi:hypothetical protein